jgi:putative transposase
MPINRRIARLAPENYLGRQTYFITICCDQRAPYLRVQATAERVLHLLLECAASHSFRLHAFCLMPDHLHVLAEGAQPRCDLREFIRLFKLRTAFEFRKAHRKPLWEMSYYDHVLRPVDSIEDVACYIWWNPVRKGLCSHPREFPYSGSQTIDWIKRASSGTPWSAPWKASKPV